MPSVAAAVAAFTMESAPSVKAPVAVESIASMEATAAVESAVTVEPVSTMKFAFTTKLAFSVELTVAPAIMIPVPPEAAPVVAPSVVTAPIIIASIEPVSVVAVIPGTCANEHAANEPIRAVVAVRRTSIGVIIIVAVSAYRRWAVVSRADANSDHHSLCMRE
jgi:hypothetical protein